MTTILSSRAQGYYDILKERQDSDRPFFLSGPTAGNKSDAAAVWRELVAAGLVTETRIANGVAKYEAIRVNANTNSSTQ